MARGEKAVDYTCVSKKRVVHIFTLVHENSAFSTYRGGYIREIVSIKRKFM
jgi:hypothetical protein